MDDTIITENQNKRISLPVYLLLFFSLFTTWQMGIVFFSGDSLSINGKTPLPITAENFTQIIIIAYILSIVFLLFAQKYSVIMARIGTGVSLVSTLALYLPLPDTSYSVLIAIQTFCCVFLIGICLSIIINLFTEKTELWDVFITAVFATAIIAVLQNDYFPIAYSAFHLFTSISLCLLLFFFFKIPCNVWPEYAKRNNELTKPKKFYFGVFFLIGLSCLITLFGTNVSESVSNGVSIFSLSTVVSGVVIFLLWKIFNVSPLYYGKFLIAISALGFLCALAGSYSAVFTYIGCALLGFGNLVCALTGFYGIVLMKSYHSRFIVPIIIIIAVVTVVVHSALLELFREDLSVLHLIYTVVSIIASVIYIIIEPYMLWSMKNKEVQQPVEIENNNEDIEHPTQKSRSIEQLDAILSSYSESSLSGQELRIAELILNGYTSGEIAEALKISENTVKGYRKNLYSKLNIHSLKELFSIVVNK